MGVAVLVVRWHDRVPALLYLRRSGGRFAGGWWPVAGTLEAGESPAACALRELAEETGLRPVSFRRTRFHAPHEDGRNHLAIFAAHVARDASVVLNEEHDALRWCTEAQARALTPAFAHAHIEEAIRLAAVPG